MAFTPVDIIDDRTEEMAVIGGLGNYVLRGTAVPGQRTFASDMTIGQTTWVFCYDPTSFAWEVDRVTFASGNQLQRTEMLASSTGSPINFPGNLCQIGMTIPAAFVLEVLSNAASVQELLPVTWLSGSNPSMTIVARAPPGGMTITSAVGRVEVQEGTTSTLQPVIVNPGSTIDDTTPLTTSLFDCNAAVAADQTLTLVSSPTLTDGQYLGLLGAGAFGTSQGSITFTATNP